MSDFWREVVSALAVTGVGILITVASRLVDRWLPDPDGTHPLPNPHLPELPSTGAVPTQK